MKLNKKLIGLMLALTIGGALVGCSSGNDQVEEGKEQIVQDKEDTEQESDEIENKETAEEDKTEEIKDETTDATTDKVEEETSKEENINEEVKQEATKPETTTPVQKPESKPDTSKPQTKPESKPDTSKPQTKPESKPDTSKPETKPETKPEESTPESKPESKPEETAMSASELMGKVIDDTIELPALNQMDSTYFADTYGIDTSLLKSYEVRTPMMIVHSTEIGIFELNNVSDASKVIAGIEKRVEGLKNQWQSYLPDQYELVQNYKTATKGNYVIFVVSEHADTIISNFNAQVK